MRTAKYYFDTEKRGVLTVYHQVEESERFIELNDEQREYFLNHRTASYDEIWNAKEYIPPTPEPIPEPTIEELREFAIKDLDNYSRETLGKSVDMLGFCDAVAGTIYSKSRGLDGVYNDNEILSTADDFLMVGKACRDLYNNVVDDINSAQTKDEIEQLVKYAKTAFDSILIVDDTLEKHKRDKIREIEVYDVSENVNGFFFNGTLMWLDKDTRTGLVNTLNSAVIVGREQINIWFSGMYITIGIEQARQLLAILEIYATDCYNVTAQHKVAVNALETIQEVDAFDVTADYPERPNFNTQE